MDVTPEVRALMTELERMMKLRRESGSALITADAYERWGPKDQPEQAATIFGAADEAANVMRETESALEARIGALRASQPEVIAAWVAAHQALLDEFLERTDDRVAASVAKEEKRKWRAVLAGKASLVHQNTFYVHYDPVLYEELFGISH